MTSIPPNTPLPDTPVRTVDVKQSETPTSQAAASSTVQATTDVGVAVVNKPSVPVKPQIPLRERKVKPFSFAKLWERFCRIFKNLGISSSDSSIKTSLAPFVTEVVPLKRFDAFDLWPQKPVVQTGQAAGLQKSNLPPREVETAQKFRNELPVELNDFAKALNRAKATGSAHAINKPKPQLNFTGKNCYMNSPLQMLENCYLQYDINCQALVDQDLTMRPNETLKAFEKRVMHAWAPINDADDVDLDQLRVQIEALDGELTQILAGQPLEKRKINQKLRICKYKKFEIENQVPELYNKQVLFKLSYLLLLQAKKYGSMEQVTEALKNHYKTVFMLDDLNLPFSQRDRQLDASDYLIIWHRMLGLGSYQASFREAVRLDGELYISDDVAIENNDFIKIALQNDQGVQVKSLMECIDRYFLDSIQNSVIKQKLAEKLESKKNELANTSILNVLKVNNLNTEIKKLEKEYLEIAGGEYTRLNGTKGMYDPQVWKPEGSDLTFDDWTTHRLLVDSPPPFFQVALNRFLADSSGANQKKITDKIPFNIDANGKSTGSFTDPLDLSRYFDPEVIQDGGAVYELIGIVQHEYGDISSGHYVAYVKRADKWYKTSDSSITGPIEIKNVPFDNCSALSYRRL